MHCLECEVRGGDAVRAKRAVRASSGGLGRLSLLYCEACGSPLSPPDATENLLAKLSQLARFGLSAGGKPILDEAAPLRGSCLLQEE